MYFRDKVSDIYFSDEGKEKMNSDMEQLEENDMTSQAHFDKCSERYLRML